MDLRTFALAFAPLVAAQSAPLRVERQPETPAAAQTPAAQPAAPPAPAPTPAKESPFTVEDELASFKLPKGYVAEIVAADPDVAKVVDVSFDDSGRMWCTTATEYPVDANETPGAAELYKKGGKDRVLVFDTPCVRTRQKPRVFAEGLAMPMSVLPIADGVLVAQGPEIFMLRDKDGDGKSDERTLVLEGFGIQDSHLMPHRLTRGPGEWIYVMQGAFNSSQVKTKSGEVVQFDQCKIGRFKADGSKFEVVGTGLNNIWGFVIDSRGEFWIQEANDMGYPVVPFYIGASYPGIGDHRAHPYSPFLAPLARFEIGGTGLSGLALSEDEHGFPTPYDRALILANPITRTIQAIQVRAHDGAHDLELEKELVSSSDAWFRPVAVHYGPDGCLYVVDWYNKIISHNEVPRTDPGRDKTHGRIWRVRHESQTATAVVDVAKLPNEQLAAHLAAESTWEARAAWHQIVDRKLVDVAPALAAIVRDATKSVRVRLLALWSLEGIGHARDAVDATTLGDAEPALRRELTRAFGASSPANAELATLLARDVAENDQGVRLEAVHALGLAATPDDQVIGVLAKLARPTPSIAIDAKDPFSATRAAEITTLVEFERSEIRAALEKHAKETAAWLDSPAAADLALESRVLATLALAPDESAVRLATLLPKLERAPSNEEVVRLAAKSADPAVGACFSALLDGAKTRDAVLANLFAMRDRLQAVDLSAPITKALRAKLAGSNDDATRDITVQLATGFRLKALEPELASIAKSAPNAARRAAAIRALTEIGSKDVALLRELSIGAAPGGEVQRACVTAIAEVKDANAIAALVEMWPKLNPILRSKALDVLSSTKDGASALLAAIDDDSIQPSELDGEVLTRLAKTMAGDKRLDKLVKDLADRLHPVLRFDGGESSVETNLELAGPFTLEAWVNLDDPIDNTDSILGLRPTVDFNFADRRFRMYGGPEGDLIIATKQLAPGTWTHVAITRDDKGNFKLYLNGEPDAAVGKVSSTGFKGLNLGVAVGPGGTRGSFSEVRLWNVARSPDEIGANFARTFAGEKVEHLLFLGTGEGPWPKQNGAVKILRTLDAPTLLDSKAQRELDSKFARFKGLAARRASVQRGSELFTATCMTCHSLHQQGAKIGPPLDGVGLRSMDSLLRAVLTPSAAVESGYRLMRIETLKGELLDGLLASENEQAIVLRRQSREDLTIPRAEIRRMGFDNRSVMPDGLLESLSIDDASALFAFLATQK